MTVSDKTFQHNIVLATKHYKVVGTRPVRHDGPDKVTGRAVRRSGDKALPKKCQICVNCPSTSSGGSTTINRG